ncbi:hypothetical protein ABBQ38_007838 [Trebouxia sp. C0009 RCD-2024]
MLNDICTFAGRGIAWTFASGGSGMWREMYSNMLTCILYIETKYTLLVRYILLVRGQTIGDYDSWGEVVLVGMWQQSSIVIVSLFMSEEIQMDKLPQESNSNRIMHTVLQKVDKMATKPVTFIQVTKKRNASDDISTIIDWARLEL